MTPQQKIGCAISIIRLFITMPIWYWLFYQVLIMVGATDIMFFLFWVYIPFTFIVAIVEVIVKEALNE